MQIIRDEDRLLEISQIKDIERISFQDIFATEGHTPVILPGFIITYGDKNTMLFLTAQDKFFEEYVRKIREVYLEEKDHVIREGIMGKQYIHIDDLSRQMLLNGDLDNVDGIYKHYDGEESYKESLLFEEDRLTAQLPIIEYHLREIAKTFGLTIGKITTSEGINGVYYMKTTIGKKPVILPVYFEQRENDWKIEIGNVLEDSIPLQIEGTYTKDGIKVHAYIEEYNYSDYTTYTLDKKKMTKAREITYNGKMIHYKEEDLPQVDGTIPNTYVELDDENDDLEWYQLPWNAFLGTKEKDLCLKEDGEIEEGEGEHRLIDRKIVYVSPRKDSFYIKEIATKRYQRRIDDRTLAQSVVLDSVNKSVIGRQKDNISLLETHFADGGVRGFYKTQLAGNYFYQIVEGEFKKENKKFIGREDGLQDKTDLLDPKVYSKKVGD